MPTCQHIYLVVHGVGDPECGETLNSFAEGIRAGGRNVIERAPLQISEMWSNRSQSNVHEVHRFEFSDAKQEVVVAEGYWADISRVRLGRFGLLRGFCDVLFGLQYVTATAARQPGRSAAAVAALGKLSKQLLQGPFAALNVVLICLFIVSALFASLVPDGYDSFAQAKTTIAFLALTFMAVSIYQLLRTTCRAGLYWALLPVSVGVLLATIIAPYWQMHVPVTDSFFPQMTWLVLQFIIGCWVILTFVVLALFLSSAVACTDRRVDHRALTVACLVPALTVGLWGQMIPSFWGLALYGARRFSLLPSGFLQDHREMIDVMLPLLGVQWTMTIVLTCVVVFVLVKYVLWRVRSQVASYQTSQPAPRLVVNRMILATSAVATFTGAITVLYLFSCYVTGDTPVYVSETLAWSHRIAIGGAALVGLVSLVGIRALVVVLDILFDVVTHFYSQSKSGVTTFPFRAAIQHRVVGTLRKIIEQYPEANSLTLVAHSQGSMAVLDVLRSGATDVYWDRFHDTRLITMGSPLRHIYQHYFPHVYPALEDPTWQILSQRVNRWENLFRIDDFVGTFINPDEAERRVHGLPVKDVPLAVGGHTGYWRDEFVARMIIEGVPRPGHGKRRRA